MQLKRDTDYALRIILYIVKQSEPEKTWLSIYDLSKNTAVPPAIIARLCRSLAEAKILNVIPSTDKTVKFALRRGAMKKTVLDIIRAVEGHNDLFAVFNRSTELYSICKDYFDETEQQFTDSLDALTIMQLKEKSKKF